MDSMSEQFIVYRRQEERGLNMTLDEAELIARVIESSDDARHLADLLSDAFPAFVWEVETAGPHIVAVRVRRSEESAE